MEHIGCDGCRGDELGFDITMAFQPIVDLSTGKNWGHEALVRGTAGESAGEILSRVTNANRYRFDQECRLKAIELASRLASADDTILSLNFQPGAVYRAATCIRASLQACRRFGFDPGRLMFEFTEAEPFHDVPHLEDIVHTYRALGFKVAIDDFGAGYAGLNLLTDLTPDVVKIDMRLIRDVDTSPRKQVILRAIVRMADDLGILLIAEGVETEAELAAIGDLGITRAQGYLLARPALEAFPEVNRPAIG